MSIYDWLHITEVIAAYNISLFIKIERVLLSRPGISIGSTTEVEKQGDGLFLLKSLSVMITNLLATPQN